jgi:methylated-DNA-[protein]-cysteine S-methyltransferase
MNEIAIDTLDAPVGRIVVAAGRHGVTHAQLESSAKIPGSDGARNGATARRHLDHAIGALEEYFTGTRRAFHDLELSPSGTDFQLRVWRALRTIPYGTTMGYGELATAIGDPGAARAVGMANNRNPLMIIVPCHRVIGADGSLVGYGGGLPNKEWLLRHEGVLEPTLFSVQS